MPRRVAAESESEAEAATEKDPGHVAMGEEDTLEALSAAPTTVHASNAPVHAPHGFGYTHLLELSDELLLLVLASLPAGRCHQMSSPQLEGSALRTMPPRQRKPGFRADNLRRTRPSSRPGSRVLGWRIKTLRPTLQRDSRF